jgi:hypothetical protein
MVVASQSGLVQLGNSESVKTALTFPLTITAAGIVVCLITSFFATHVWVVKEKRDIEASLKRQLLISTILMTPTAYALCVAFLPEEFALAGIDGHMVKNFKVFYCIACGLWSGLIIGYVTEYYTSNTYRPVREVADACETGAATNIIYGLALGYKSVIVPVVCLCLTSRWCERSCDAHLCSPNALCARTSHEQSICTFAHSHTHTRQSTRRTPSRTCSASPAPPSASCRRCPSASPSMCTARFATTPAGR